MQSRYDYMQASKVLDIDKEAFPDPLTVRYNNIQFSQIPTYKVITSADLEKFWLYMYENYGITDLDDILLNINGVPYIGMLDPGDILYNISMEDLSNFNSQKILGTEEA